MQILIGLFFGALVPVFIQLWIFYDYEKKEQAKLHAFLTILNEDLRSYYNFLFTGVLQGYCATPIQLLGNFKNFNTSNKHAMWPELMKFEVFRCNLGIFTKINNIIHQVELLNFRLNPLIPERYNIRIDSIEVHNWRDHMNQIRSLYDTINGENSVYEDTDVGRFLTKIVKNRDGHKKLKNR
jgi:hypothetical protein